MIAIVVLHFFILQILKFVKLCELDVRGATNSETTWWNTIINN